MRAQTGSSGNEFTYAGEQTDSTGLQYPRARFLRLRSGQAYDPAVGRFLSRDPLPLLQRYAYVGNSPATRGRTPQRSWRSRTAASTGCSRRTSTTPSRHWDLGEGDRDGAVQHALTGYERAWCDGPPHCYKPALDEAERLLKELGVEPPVLETTAEG